MKVLVKNAHGKTETHTLASLLKKEGIDLQAIAKENAELKHINAETQKLANDAIDEVKQIKANQNEIIEKLKGLI